jgi:hypothetical protein
MIDRIFNNWKTTLIGLAIIVGSIALVYLQRAALSEALAFITGGVALFFTKDGKGSADKQPRQ